MASLSGTLPSSLSFSGLWNSDSATNSPRRPKNPSPGVESKSDDHTASVSKSEQGSLGITKFVSDQKAITALVAAVVVGGLGWALANAK
jgi:hypothetical protein